MQKSKKLLTLLMAAAILLCLTPALYAADSGSITINNAVVGQTYTVYRIFDLESYNEKANAYLYSVNANWEAFISGTSVNGVYVTVDDQTGVTWVDGANAQNFAKLAMDYVTQNSVSATASAAASSTSVTFSGLAFGYYLVDTSLGALCSLSNVTADATVVEKNSEPMVNPLIGGTNTDSISAAIGNSISMDAMITVGSTTSNYVLHIEHGSGLTCKVGKPYILMESGVQDTFSTSGYSTDTSTVGTTTVTITRTLTENQVVYVPITLTLNTNAVIGSAGNPVKLWLTYGSGSTTAAAVTTIYSWDLPIYKYTGTDTPLAGAEFTITNGSSSMLFKQVSTSGTAVYVPDGSGTYASITTDSTGRFILRGLASGTYTLTETAAPEGFAVLSDPITVVIGDDGTLNATTDNPSGVTEIKVLNQSGTKLPETGGIGTTIVVCVGFVILTASGVLFVTKLRMKTREHM
ncbi:MAG: LPXTG cell wall anchor domain-containing protein [Clostridia bacterium]|nr:LPXTG cell wall anchor domain-containing protein [Clostridia bacterium]